MNPSNPAHPSRPVEGTEPTQEMVEAGLRVMYEHPTTRPDTLMRSILRAALSALATAEDTARLAKLSGLSASDDIVIQQEGDGIRIRLCLVTEVVSERASVLDSNLSKAIDNLPIDAARAPQGRQEGE